VALPIVASVMPPPLVAVVTPIYNGVEQVRGCVESVLAQTHPEWVHVLVDNASTDGTSALLVELAALDRRVRVISSSDYLDMAANWNRSLAEAPPEARYVRQLNVDDRLRPTCLARMVEALERHPEAALASSYFSHGSLRLPRCEHAAEVVVEGRTVVRNLFLGGTDYLGLPSVLLLRRAAFPEWPKLYTTGGFPPAHASRPPLGQVDKEGFFRALSTEALVFVPEELTLLRRDVDSATGYSSRVGAWHAGWLELLLRHGAEFLEPGLFEAAVRRITLKYLRSSAWRSLKGEPFRDHEFRHYQRLALEALLPRLRERGYTFEARLLSMFGFLVGAHAGGKRSAGAETSATMSARPNEEPAVSVARSKEERERPSKIGP